MSPSPHEPLPHEPLPHEPLPPHVLCCAVFEGPPPEPGQFCEGEDSETTHTSHLLLQYLIHGGDRCIITSLHLSHPQGTSTSAVGPSGGRRSNVSTATPSSQGDSPMPTVPSATTGYGGWGGRWGEQGPCLQTCSAVCVYDPPPSPSPLPPPPSLPVGVQVSGL